MSVQWGLCDNDSSYKVDDNIVRWQYMIDNGIICNTVINTTYPSLQE